MAGLVKVLAFAGARDVIGAAEVDIELGDDAVTVRDLMDRICGLYPKLNDYRPIIRVAVNGAYADGADPVGTGDEVALIPPVAGG